MSHSWHILTGEYPPQPGGVSDYTALVASWLVAAGDQTIVYAPPTGTSETPQVVRLPDHFGIRALISLQHQLQASDPRAIVLVQYVPHMYGMKGMNLLFTLWLWLICPRRVWVMFHEVAYPLTPRQPWKERLLAIVQCVMAMMVLRRAEQVFVSIPGWLPRLRRLAHPMPPTRWLPIPSNVSEGDPRRSIQLRQTLFPSHTGWVVGHFGTYGESIRSMLEPVLISLLKDERVAVLLIGRGSEEFATRLIAHHAVPHERLRTADSIPLDEVGDFLLACDLLFQPYPDGASSRRTSLMAGLSLGIPVVSNLGSLSESFWKESGAIAVTAPQPSSVVMRIRELLESPQEHQRLAANAQEQYQSRFSINVIGTQLRQLASE